MKPTNLEAGQLELVPISSLTSQNQLTLGRALDTYQSAFAPERVYEVVPQRRQDGDIGLDERVYLSNPPSLERERPETLKRTAIAYPSGNTTAIVFDQLLYADRKA